MKYEADLALVVKVNFSIGLAAKIFLYTSIVFLIFSEVSVDGVFALVITSLIISSVAAFIIIGISGNISSLYPGRKIYLLKGSGYWFVEFPWRVCRFPVWMMKSARKDEIHVRFPFSLLCIYVKFPIREREVSSLSDLTEDRGQ